MTTPGPKLSRLSLRDNLKGSYRKLKEEMPGKIKWCRVVSLFRKPKEELGIES